MTSHGRWAIEEYRTASGESPIRRFVDSLEGRDLTDALTLIKLAEEGGNQLRGPHSKALVRDRIPESALRQAERFKADLKGRKDCG